MPRKKPKTSHTLRLGKSELEWLSRHGKGLGRQLREDLALLRMLLRTVDESLTLRQARELVEQFSEHITG